MCVEFDRKFKFFIDSSLKKQSNKIMLNESNLNQWILIIFSLMIS